VKLFYYPRRAMRSRRARRKITDGQVAGERQDPQARAAQRAEKRAGVSGAGTVVVRPYLIF